jgi:phosphatidylglycerol:prolipoprotein diacylglycerol transferase
MRRSLPLCNAARAVFPILFRIGSYEVPSYGIALTLGFALGIWLARRRAAARKIDPDKVLDVCMVILVTSILGARILWVATHTDQFQPPYGTWGDAFNPFRGGSYVGFAGLSVLGGVVGATLSALAFMFWRGLPVLSTADVLAPSVALGQAVTRIGCLLNGCCYGTPCTGWYCIAFPDGTPPHLAYDGHAVHATQLYSSAAGFVFFVVLSLLLSRRLFDGAVFGAFLVLLGAERIFLDLVRHQDPSVVWFQIGATPFGANQAVGVAMLLAGVAVLAILASRRPPVARRA